MLLTVLSCRLYTALALIGPLVVFTRRPLAATGDLRGLLSSPQRASFSVDSKAQRQ